MSPRCPSLLGAWLREARRGSAFSTRTSSLTVRRGPAHPSPAAAEWPGVPGVHRVHVSLLRRGAAASTNLASACRSTWSCWSRGEHGQRAPGGPVAPAIGLCLVEVAQSSARLGAPWAGGSRGSRGRPGWKTAWTRGSAGTGCQYRFGRNPSRWAGENRSPYEAWGSLSEVLFRFVSEVSPKASGPGDGAGLPWSEPPSGPSNSGAANRGPGGRGGCGRDGQGLPPR